MFCFYFFINPLSHLWFVSIFLLSVICLLIFLLILFTVQKCFLFVVVPQVYLFLLWLSCFCCHVKKYIYIFVITSDNRASSVCVQEFTFSGFTNKSSHLIYKSLWVVWTEYFNNINFLIHEQGLSFFICVFSNFF